MALSPGLHVSQTKRLALTPSLRQSISILSMSGVELAELIKAEMEENPVLSVESDHAPNLAADYQFALETVAQPQTTGQHLREQIALRTIPEDIRHIAEYLTEDLTEEGYLADSDEMIAATLGQEIGKVSQATTLLQSLDPVGICARNLRECLDLQLRALGESGKTRNMIFDNLAEFDEANWPRLERDLNIPRAELHRLADLLQSLNPFPADRLLADTAPSLYPDVNVLTLPEGGFGVELVNSVAPTLVLMAPSADPGTTADPGARDYLRDRTNRATSLIRAIEARSKTILRVASAIVTFQHRFFVDGHAHLRPLTQAAIAGELGLHPSTLNRAIAGKSLDCTYGVFPLKFFFTNSIKSLGQESGLSAYVVQQRIRKLINDETPEMILSDEDITRLLQQSGVDIARRTVAKYRQCLKIPSSVQRRRSKRVL